MEYIGLIDFILLPIYLVVIYQLAKLLQNKWYPVGHPWRKHFMQGLMIKVGGATFISLIYLFYYDGVGDTISYFKFSKIINELLWKNPIMWFKLLLHIPAWYEAGYIDYISRILYYNVTSNFYICSISSIVSLFAFQRFLITSVLFSVLAYTGIWALFRTFATQYPNMLKATSISILYVPSVAIWGSGIFKDTICMFALGWMTYTSFKLLVNYKLSVKNIFILISSVLIIGSIKVYILVAFIPAISFWILAVNIQRVHSIIIKFLLRIALPVTMIFTIFILNNSFKESLGVYSLEKVFETSENLRKNIAEVSDLNDGSTYELGEISPNNAFGLMKKIPAAVNVTLFRPYPWEYAKVIIFLNSLESFLLLCITIFVITRFRIDRLIKIIYKSANLQFFLLFTIVFAFAVGISTYNFGTLSRYKIPCIPFYCMFLGILYYEYVPRVKSSINISGNFIGRKITIE